MCLACMMMRDQEVKVYVMHRFGHDLPKTHFSTDDLPICRTPRLEDLRRARTQMYVDWEEEDDKEAEEEEEHRQIKREKRRSSRSGSTQNQRRRSSRHH